MHTHNRSIIVSGGSRGLGLELVSQFLKNGNRVASFARSKTPEIIELSSFYNEMFIFEELDAVDAQGINSFVACVAKKFGEVNCLVNNAAIGQDQLLIHTSLDDVKRIIDINTIGPTILTRAVLKRMMLSGGGSICNVSSICGSRGYAGLSVYAGTKGYLDAMSRALVREVGEAGIYINCVAPGFFESEMSSVLRPEQMDTIKRRTPSGRLSSEQDIFNVVDLVISGKTNIQGQTIFVDGGITC